MGEGISIARTTANELDAAKFDPMLVKAVAKNVHSSLEMLLSRLDPLVRSCFCFASFSYKDISVQLADEWDYRSLEIGGQLACLDP